MIYFLLIFYLVQSVRSQISFNKQYSIKMYLTTVSWIDSIWFIDEFNTKNKMGCIAHCNKNENCLSLIFIPDAQSTSNCFLYNKYFDPNELVPSNSSILINKECKSIFIFKLFFLLN